MNMRMGFAEWLGEQIRYKKTNASGLARMIGTSHVTVLRWLNGTYLPKTEHCYRIAEYLEVPAEKVLTLAGHLKPSDTPVRLRENREDYMADPRLDLLREIAARLSPENRNRLIAIARALIDLEGENHE